MQGFTIEILTSLMMASPNQKCYDLWERVWKMLLYDTYTNFLPQAASMSGPSGRHYDVTTGLHGKSDYWSAHSHTSNRRQTAKEEQSEERMHRQHAHACCSLWLLICQGHAFVRRSAVPAKLRVDGTP